MTSAYLAVNFPSQYNWFALVTSNDKSVAFKDPAMKKFIFDKTGIEVEGTLEMDDIVYTIMDLEQYMGQKIDIVIGKTFDEVIESKYWHLPNISMRYCTTEMKIRPLFHHWYHSVGQPIEMQIGFRADESYRADRMLKKTNADGFSEFKGVIGRTKTGNQNKWATLAWQKPIFPLIENKIFKDEIVKFWEDKPVRFAKLNNCVGCFHRNPILLRQMHDVEPNKMEWFASKERHEKSPRWKKGMTYDEIIKHKLQLQLDLEEWENDCDSGHCGL